MLKLRKSYSGNVLRAIAVFLSLALLISCSKDKRIIIPGVENSDQDSVSNPSTNAMDSGKITYLALGDSYTIGESVPQSENFPFQLVSLLRNDSIKADDPDIIAVTGWTTENLLAALSKNPPKSNYSFVTLLIGVNNQYQGRPLEEYKTQFSQLLHLAILYAANRKDRVFVLSIPDYSVTPFGNNINKVETAQQIDEFNRANFLISQNAGVNYLDITPISREVANDPSLVARDGLHPSSKQYLKWDQKLEPLILSKFR